MEGNSNTPRVLALKIGGSFLLGPDGQPQVAPLKEMAETVRALLQRHFKVRAPPFPPSYASLAARR